MTTLITGAGLVGCHAARILVERGERPILFDVAPSLDYVDSVVGLDKVKVVRGDILDLPELISVVKDEKVERIIHTAALVANMYGRFYSGMKINILGTTNVLETARLMDVKRVVFCSSQAVYDLAVPAEGPMSEDHPLRPRNFYATSKVAGEYIGLNYVDIYDLDFVALRWAPIFGLGSWAGGSVGGRFIHEVVEKAILGEPAVVKAPFSLTNKVEYFYVKDAARAVVLACYAEDPKSRIYNIGCGKLYALSEVVDTIKRLVPGAKVMITEPGVGGVPAYRGHLGRSQPYDLSRARNELGYEPAYALEEGFRDYIDLTRRVLCQK